MTTTTPDQPGGEPAQVDQIPEPKRTAFDRITARREGEKKPIIVPWLRDAAERTQIVRWAVGYAWHVGLFHLVRLPLYQWRLMQRAPIGVGQTVKAIGSALTDSEARPLRRSAVARDDVKEYMQLARERNARIRHRAVAAAAIGFAVLLLVLLIVFAAAPALRWLAGEALIIGFGVAGRSRTTPLISKATTPLHIAPVLRQDAVEVALRSLPSVLKKDAALEWPDPIIKDGPGWLARVTLPPGVTAQQVMANRPGLSSGLRRPRGCVWPAQGPEHDGDLLIWVGFQDIRTARQPAYPLLERGTTDAFAAMPYGTNQRGSKVGITLMENNVLIGSMAGQGKTSAMRVLGCAVALDPTVELRIWELKGSGDLDALAQVAHTYGSGQDDETARGCLEDLRAIRAEVERRSIEIKKLARKTPELVPNNKTTRELANRRDLGLHPMVVLLDEVQNLYSHETYGKEAGKLALDIIRLGRAFGVILIQATQRPDAESLPRGISANAGIRIALRVMDADANNMILGSGMYASGIRATEFTPKDKGIAWLVGVEDEPIVAKSYNLDATQAKRIGERARKLREEAGRLTGHAIDQDVARAEDRAAKVDLLDDIRQVMSDQGVGWMWNASAAGALTALRPEAYDGLTADTLGRLLAKRGVKTRAMNRNDPDGSGRKNLVGFDLEDVVRAQSGPLQEAG
ncbi:cell division protein FtsK [Pseudonocardia sp. RS010]|uniref:cell division protein FtsK n=1 Tax=Pseudonocardia sp. RS010 TaxID=3385979 RepID=UPI0039A36588